MSDSKLDLKCLPKHIAIILDGNGRWAKKRGLPRNLGHRKGAFNLKDIAVECDKLHISHLTVYCFSTENWNRPKKEVDYLFNQPIKYFHRYRSKLSQINIKVKFIGRRDRFSDEFLKCLEEVEEVTKNNTGLTLTIACDYGSYEELTTATKKIAQMVKDNIINIDDITPELISNNLYTKDYPDLDLLIRTSGEIRISNYLLWQLAYSELYFTDVYWPDFDVKELHKALNSYANRNRRFGGLKEEEK